MEAYWRGELSMSLKTMTVSKLTGLRLEVEAAIRAKVLKRRHEIETVLSKLSQFEAVEPAKAVRTRARGMFAAKVAKKLDKALGADGAKVSRRKQRKRLKRSRNSSKLGKAANGADTVLSFPAPVNKIEALPIESPSAASIDANVVPVDVSAAA
jgi:predicted oxidoreductase